MARFRRRATSADADDPVGGGVLGDDLHDEDEADSEADDPGSGPAEDVAGSGFDRSHGPFDEAEADSADPDLPRLDLGSLRIPGLSGISVQVEADPGSQEVRAVTAVGDQAAVQLQVFAAPRSEGLWDEIRAEMLAELGGTAGARVTEGEGHFGPELRGVLPARAADGKQSTQAVRFVGVDGPRWFLRVVFLGRAAVEPDPEDALHQLVRETIVVRGGAAMAPRDPLPLTLPAATVEDADADAGDPAPEGQDADADGSDERYGDLDPFERGPEITETR